MLSAVSFVDHDFILASLARETLERARADAARHRLGREARRANRRESHAIPRIAAGRRITGVVALVIQELTRAARRTGPRYGRPR